MQLLGFIISIHFIILVIYLLTKRLNPQAIFFCCGLSMLIISVLSGMDPNQAESGTGIALFNIFYLIKDIFLRIFSESGLAIMTIGGFVAYMKKIGASDALVSITIRPLSIFQKQPYLALSLTIPIGQLLFISIPSATGLGLLLVATLLPIFLNLGISRISIVSVITACTAFDMGQSSLNTERAIDLIGMDKQLYFTNHQLPVVLPCTIILMILYYFLNKYYDKKIGIDPRKHVKRKIKISVPRIYSILPLMPILLLVIFSPAHGKQVFNMDITTAMLITIVITLLFEFIRTKSVIEVFSSFKVFWEGMARIFGSVITLIVCADIFSKGLISLGLIDSFISASQTFGFSPALLILLVVILIFTVSVLTGSANASFNSFGTHLPKIADKFGIEKIDLILPGQLASSIGRATSPISGVVIASSEIAKVSSFDVMKRNIIPMSVIIVFLLLLG